MADEDGLLSASEMDAAIKWLTSLNKETPTCPLCKNQNWVVGERMVRVSAILPTFQHHATVSFYPFITVMCARCGYTMLMNAVPMGLFQKDEEPSSARKETGASNG